jgi:hypothetical protein
MTYKSASSSRKILEDLSPVSTIEREVCSCGRNKEMAKELTSKGDISAAKQKVSTRRNGGSIRG